MNNTSEDRLGRVLGPQRSVIVYSVPRKNAIAVVVPGEDTDPIFFESFSALESAMRSNYYVPPIWNPYLDGLTGEIRVHGKPTYCGN